MQSLRLLPRQSQPPRHGATTAPTTAAFGVLLVLCTLAATTHGACQFPKAWTGRWFQSGVRQLVEINTTAIETKGVCVENSGDRFVMEDTSGPDVCYRCIFITENHLNVLQYKETYCIEEYDSLNELCYQISGDASLYLLFRDQPDDAGAETCPFKGAPFTFTYNRGTGDCGTPVSRIDSCIQESRLRIHYQACPDIHGTESAVEELVCMAAWKEGSVRYLIGKISRKAGASDEDRYRCYAYERTVQHDGKVVYHVAQSADATCSGLQSAHEGSKTMKLTKVDTEHTRCRFPKWVSDHHTWHSLDSTTVYHLSQKNATLRIAHARDAAREMRVVCHAVESNGEAEVRLVAHATRACHSGYVCMVFYRRDGHVIELQQSNVTVQVPEEACSPSVFDQQNTPYTTLVTMSLRPRKCPHAGRYQLRASASAANRVRREDDGVDGADCNTEHYQQLAVGCARHQEDTMEFQASCSTKPDAYSCHASWELNGTSYLIASPVSRSSVGARRYCFIYATRQRGGSDDGDRAVAPVTLTSVTESCHRGGAAVETAGLFNFNLTLSDECDHLTTGAVSTTAVLLPSVFFVVALMTALTHVR